ncbi:MAG TPA: FAD-binding oxidoreductase [Candidatus Thermoplasmatota archaeon]|nr:FAD-binding oxidoreductase [Candidatus Thermoplasmatota archaeon]
MKDRAQVVIIGGGVNGLGTAYQLAKAGMKDVVVLEKKYVMYGASGRNGGGIRAQWGTAENVTLARESIRMFNDLSAELNFNVWFRQGGYLFLAFDEKTLKALDKTTQFHRTVGVKSRVIDVAEASVIAPDLNTEGVVGASFCPTDGIIFPWAVLQGYWQKVREMGVQVETFTGVTGFDQSGGKIRKVRTTRGDIACETVVNAAGCWSRDIAAMAGVKLPNEPVRHEIMVTEALKPFLDPMVVDLRTGLYMNQDMRGEIVAGIGDPHEKPGINFGSSFDFLRRVSRGITDLFPRMRDVRVMRQWAGMYDVTPDNKPVLGRSPGVENLIQLNGASGHGFMVSPMTTKLTAELILHGKARSMDITPFLVDRFDRPLEVQPDAMVIG